MNQAWLSSVRRTLRALACVLALACLVAPFAAVAAPARGAPGTPGSGNLTPLAGTDRPAHFHLTAAEAISRARASDAGRALLRAQPGLRAAARAPDLGLWSVAFLSGAKTRGAVEIEDRTGTTLEGGAWSWPQTGSPMDSFKRGMEGFLLLLGVLFVAGMVDWRRPLSLRTLDALALTAGFGAAFAFFDRAQPLVAIPLAMPVLIYLFARMLAVGLRGARGEERWPRRRCRCS